MCGICGFVTKQIINLEALKEMNDTMYHRGPNDSGEEISYIGDNYYLGLAHRRLSILDLSLLGHQPMHSENNRVSVVFNGEIYNFNEIKKELRDYPFKSTCDTEVIIASYLKWGINCIKKFNGMFAIALFDRENNSLYLIRDGIGKKPLYYWIENDNIVFASELKPILKHPMFKKTINKKVIPRYLYQQYINAPDSIFENVYKLEAGMILQFTLGNINKSMYWNLYKIYHEKKRNLIINYEEAKEELTEKLKRAVAQRMIADVPIGTFLSGGIDSSLITALAQFNSIEPIKSFSIGFEEKRYNEAEYAKSVSNHLGTKHTELYVSHTDMLTMVEGIPQYYDEPYADSSQIPSMLVSQLAHKDVTVVLSGDGGDELFCGYQVYQDAKLAQRLDFIGDLINKSINIPIIKPFDLSGKLPLKVNAILENRDINTKVQFGKSGYIDIIKQIISEQSIPVRYPIELEIGEKNWQIRRMLLDMKTYLPEDILSKVDRASMRYSLEARCPILDKEIIEYSFRLPQNFKYSNNIAKRILKDICYKYIPRDLVDRPKQGFAVPIDTWLRTLLKEQLIEYSRETYLERQGVFNPKNTQKIVDDYILLGDKGPGTGRNPSIIIWPFFVFQLWYIKYY